MEIKLFGKSLFEAKKAQSNQLWGMASTEVKESKYLPDFYNESGGEGIWSDYAIAEISSGASIAYPTGKKAKVKPVAKKKVVTPKGVYDLKMLHDKAFKLNTDPAYVEGQIADFKEKLDLLKSEEYDMRRGVTEIGSIILRMENRKKYPEVKTFFEDYPYTTTTKIRGVVKEHDNLKLGQVAQFVADMPKEAVDIMKSYEKATINLCGKKTVFYIIADKKDFQKSNTRRDPILLAQSPFGHFWQILGAWDKEMLFIEEL